MEMSYWPFPRFRQLSNKTGVVRSVGSAVENAVTDFGHVISAIVDFEVFSGRPPPAGWMNTIIEVNHGFIYEPVFATMVLKCLVSDCGFLAGDITPLACIAEGVGANVMPTVYWNKDAVGFVGSTGAPSLANKQTGAITAIGMANWSPIFRVIGTGI